MPELLAQATDGVTVEITQYGQPVAQLVAPDPLTDTGQCAAAPGEIYLDEVRWVDLELVDPWEYPPAPIPGTDVVVCTITDDFGYAPVGRVDTADPSGVYVRFPGPVRGHSAAYATFGELRTPPSIECGHGEAAQ